MEMEVRAYRGGVGWGLPPGRGADCGEETKPE